MWHWSSHAGWHPSHGPHTRMTHTRMHSSWSSSSRMHSPWSTSSRMHSSWSSASSWMHSSWSSSRVHSCHVTSRASSHGSHVPPWPHARRQAPGPGVSELVAVHQVSAKLSLNFGDFVFHLWIKNSSDVRSAGTGSPQLTSVGSECLLSSLPGKLRCPHS